MTGMKDTLQDQMDWNLIRTAHDSRRFPGHNERMADHARRINSPMCECGSGKTYGACCLINDHQRSLARISYSLPDCVHRDVAIRCEIEDHLRVRAFSVFYKASHQEHDLLIRFARALVASAGPIRDERQVRRWQRRFCKRPSRKLREASQ